jgi:hypothetical protein
MSLARLCRQRPLARKPALLIGRALSTPQSPPQDPALTRVYGGLKDQDRIFTNLYGEKVQAVGVKGCWCVCVWCECAHVSAVCLRNGDGFWAIKGAIELYFRKACALLLCWC